MENQLGRWAAMVSKSLQPYALAYFLVRAYELGYVQCITSQEKGWRKLEHGQEISLWGVIEIISKPANDSRR